MSVMPTFLRHALYSGRLLLHEPLLHEPLPPRLDAETMEVLEAAYRLHALNVAGPAIAFDATASVAAARVLFQAGWYLLNPNAAIDNASLQMPADPRSPPRSPSAHLCADLLLRYLPAVSRRARAMRPNDALASLLADVLRRWPLSGVLADIADPPLTPLEFGHPGLRLLYAERLAQHEKPAWLPSGVAMEAVELVWQQLGRDIDVLRLAARAANPQAEGDFRI
jgi:hypothetical protein